MTSLFPEQIMVANQGITVHSFREVKHGRKEEEGRTGHTVSHIS